MMGKASFVVVVILVLLALSSCSNKGTVPPAERRQATVMLQDGSQVSGAVVSSTATEITLAGDDNITRAIPMTQVRSVQYGEPAAQPQSQAEAQPAAPPPVKKPAAAPARESVAQPSRPASLARTFELPAGTELPVRTNETIDSAKAAEGQDFAAEVSQDVVNAAGTVVIPRGSQAQ